MTAGRAVALHADGLRKAFGGVLAVERFSLDVLAGEFVAILGPSGSGKTTALRLISGFERPDAGTLELWGETVAGPGVFVPPERRGVGMVFQDYALFPHMSVAENVAFGLQRSADRARLVEEALALTGLPGYGRRSVHELSGGEQQRVALARALAPRPRVLLLDEPFSNLDAALRARVRHEVREIVQRAGTTAILVTHDQEEALSMADRLAYLWRGRIEQYGPPREVYNQPATLHVAASLGDPCVLHADALDGRVPTPFGDYPAPAGAARCAVVVRPEDLYVNPEGAPAEVCGREFYGHDAVLHIRTAEGHDLRMRVGPGEHWEIPEGPVRLGLRRPPPVFADEAGDAVER
jgi:iron(III) transport system ATP-binding protein